MAEYDLTPIAVPLVETKYRSIKTKIPVPESLPIFAALKESEPRSMMGQPPIIWHQAEDCTVSDKWGNRWIDWSSGVLITNIGHAHPEVKAALQEMLDQGLLATYVFIHEKRAELTKALQQVSPDPENYHVFLLSTGAEATENCIKRSKSDAVEKYGPRRKYFVTFEQAFHGRTLGAQLAGGSEALKSWIVDRDQTFVQVPFPDGFRCTDTSFDLFLSTLQAKGIQPDEIAGVMFESYQGGGPNFMPVDYAQKLEKFCRDNDIVLTCDEVQSGFGRTGKFFCFQHYGITPDLIACGKGISSSLPISAAIGRKDIMGMYAPGSMTSTHSGSPLPVAAALANLKVLLRDKMTENAARMGEIMLPELERIQQKYPQRLAVFMGKGLVAGIQVVKPGTKDPDGELAQRINLACIQKGLLMFAPVGMGGACLKIAPPLSITEEPLRESLQVFAEAVDEVMAAIGCPVA